MTNLHLAILSTVLTLAIGAGLWIVHRRITTCMSGVVMMIAQTERSLRSHVVDEMDQIQTHTTSLAVDTFQRLEHVKEDVIGYVQVHAADLHKHAEDLRNHAKELSDRAEVQASPPRQAVTRN